MYSHKFTLQLVATLALAFVIASCSDNETVVDTLEASNVTSQFIPLDVYKSPSCGCCKKWLSHINENGFESTIHSDQNFSIIKEKQGIEPRYRSCHTAISKAGYVFEGHVPAKFIQQFLTEKHASDIIGLSVPAMPIGTPGMEVDDKFQPYRILLLKSDGTYEIYAHIRSYKEQF